MRFFRSKKNRLSSSSLKNIMDRIILMSCPYVGCSIRKEPRVLIEVLPRNFRNIECNAFDETAIRRGKVDDSCGFESLNDAIICAEIVCSRLVFNIKPENLLFFFGQSVESFKNFLFYVPFLSNFDEVPIDELSGPAESYCQRDDKSGADKRAIIFCKLRKTEDVEKITAWKKQQGGRESDRYKVTWSELQDLKQTLDKF